MFSMQSILIVIAFEISIFCKKEIQGDPASFEQLFISLLDHFKLILGDF